ncbi:hypothetical protein [Clostridium sp.]|uniref:hypothetical protein n=1 Tax=Clostridium sp. TaxID=1506 RepID=UPI0032164634
MVKVKTGRRWKQEIGKKAFYSPELQDGKYYMLKNYSHSRDFTANIYTFEEVEIVD